MEGSSRKPTYEELEAENAQLRRRVAQLEKRVAELERLLDKAIRSGKRQAAPFRKGEPKSDPKKPGRKPGEAYGTKARRPIPEQIDETHIAELPAACPDCGGEVASVGQVEQFHTDIVQQVVHRRFVVKRGRCRQCGSRLRGRHDLMCSEGRGAAKVGLGPKLHAAIALLRKQAGLSDAKTASLCSQLLGVSITPGAVAQSAARTAKKLQDPLAEIDGELKTAPMVVPDETGFRINGRNAWCHVAVSEQSTRCVIDTRRSAEVTERILGLDWDGVLVHDGYASYGTHFPDVAHQQCNAHALRRAKELLERAGRRARCFPNQVIALFQSALAARDLARAGPEARRVELYETFIKRLDQLTVRVRADAEQDRFRRHLRDHCAEWFCYLLDPTLDATNWRAEQAIRPMVLQRKNWGGVRSTAGARTHETICSVLATLRQRKLQPYPFLIKALTNQNPTLSIQG